MIPTFLGTTLLVFVILQIAPDGPFERAVKQLKAGEGGSGEGGSGIGGGNTASKSNELTPELLEEMRMQYGLDKPILVRYLIWLGIYPKEVNTKTLSFGEEFRETIQSIEINQFKEFLLQRYIRVEENNGEVNIIGTGAGLEFELPTLNLLKSKYNIDSNKEDLIEFYRGHYEELPNESQYIKTWYHSDWIIKEINQDKQEVVITKKSYKGILTGFLGYSQMRGKKVSTLIKERLHISVIFGLAGFLLSYLVCIPLGISKAIRHGSKFDILSSSIVFIGYSIPGYALGVLLLSIWGGDIFPLYGWRSTAAIWNNLTLFEKIGDQVWHAFLPILCYVVGSFATLTVLMKNSLMENLSQDYVRTAFAKGLSEKRVILYHAVRNSLIPLATGIGTLIGVFLDGSYLIEMVFGIDGFGMLSLQALLDRDYNIIMGNLVILTTIRLFGNLISDISYAIIDPRIRFK